MSPSEYRGKYRRAKAASGPPVGLYVFLAVVAMGGGGLYWWQRSRPRGASPTVERLPDSAPGLAAGLPTDARGPSTEASPAVPVQSHPSALPPAPPESAPSAADLEAEAMAIARAEALAAERAEREEVDAWTLTAREYLEEIERPESAPVLETGSASTPASEPASTSAPAPSPAASSQPVVVPSEPAIDPDEEWESAKSYAYQAADWRARANTLEEGGEATGARNMRSKSLILYAQAFDHSRSAYRSYKASGALPEKLERIVRMLALWLRAHEILVQEYQR